jgi:putative molybdopterin biosynthesis protein
MIKLTLRYEWQPEPGKGTLLDAALFEVLHAVHETGSIAAAARRVGLSYRHVWGLGGKWQKLLGEPLFSLRQGRGARLTPFGEKLLWAHELVQARLTPDLESVRQEIERALQRAGDGASSRLSICASHDLALAQLRDRLAQRDGLKLDVRFQGSLESLGALAREQCVLAGFHVAEGLEDSAAEQFRRLLNPRRHRLIGLATRTQGLMVGRGNPARIASLADLARPGVRFVNRQQGSGSRIEFDQLLSGAGIDPAAISGYQNEEFTHLAVAATVAGGRADAGFGIEAAAAEYELHYLPLLTERYYFACRREALLDPGVQDFLALLGGDEFRRILCALPGYGGGIAGRVFEMGDALSTPRQTGGATQRALHGTGTD